LLTAPSLPSSASRILLGSSHGIRVFPQNASLGRDHSTLERAAGLEPVITSLEDWHTDLCATPAKWRSPAVLPGDLLIFSQPCRLPTPEKQKWERGVDSNHRPSAYEADELPDCSTPHSWSQTPVPTRDNRPYEGRWIAVSSARTHGRRPGFRSLPLRGSPALARL
jgi:hypothetical protein